MANKWDISGAMKLIEQRSDDFTSLAADITLSEIKTKTPRDRGNLINSNDKRHVGPSHYQVFNNAVYAAQREYGGVIKAFRGKYLTIPIHPDSKHRQASDFGDDLFFLPGNGDSDAFLVRENSRGNDLEFMFLLKTQVKQKATPFMRPGMRAARGKIRRLAKRFEV